MTKLDILLSDLDEALSKLRSVRQKLKGIKDDEEAVEKARDQMRGRNPGKKDRKP